MRLFSVKILLPLLFTFWLPWDASAAQKDILRLDQILVSSGGVDGLLKNEHALENYHQTLLNYLEVGPEKLPRSLFEKIIRQYEELESHIPRLSERAMSASGLGTAFQIQSYKPGNASMPPRVYLKNWWIKIEESAAAFERGTASKDRARITRALFEGIAEEQKKISALPRRAQSAAMAEFFKSLGNKTQVREAAAFLLRDRLKSLQFPEKIDSALLDELRSLLFDMRKNALGEGVAPSAQWLVRKLVPTEQELQTALAAEESHSDHEKGDLWEVTPIPRRFHGVWKGIKHQECIGGSVDYIDDVSPRRWSTALSEDTEVFSVFRNGKYLGFIQLLPIESVKTGEMYASIDLGASNLDEVIHVKTPDDTIKASLAIDEVLRKLLETMPKAWKGIVKSQSDAISNAGALPAIRDSLAHRFGRYIGDHTRFTYVDREFADEIYQNTEMTTKIQAPYKGASLVFDAHSDEEGSLRLLTDPAQIQTGAIKGIEAILGNRKGKDFADVFASLLEVAPETQEIKDYLQARYARTHSRIKTYILEKLQLDIDQGTFHSNSLVKLAYPSFSRITKLFHYNEGEEAVFSWQKRSLKNAMPLLLSYDPSWEEFRDFLRALRSDVEGSVFLRKEWLVRVKDPKDYIELIGSEVNEASDSYAKALDEFTLEHLHAFFSKKPGIEDITKLLAETHFTETALRIRELASTQVKTIEDFKSLFSPENDDLSEEYRESIERLMMDKIDIFFSKKPALDDMKGLLKSLHTTSAAIAIRKKMLQKAKTAEEYFEIMDLESLDHATHEYLSALDLLAAEKSADFFNLDPKPTLEELRYYIAIPYSHGTAMLILKSAADHGLVHAKEESEYLLGLRNLDKKQIKAALKALKMKFKNPNSLWKRFKGGVARFFARKKGLPPGSDRSCGNLLDQRPRP